MWAFSMQRSLPIQREGFFIRETFWENYRAKQAPLTDQPEAAFFFYNISQQAGIFQIQAVDKLSFV